MKWIVCLALAAIIVPRAMGQPVPSVFENPIPVDQLAFLAQLDGTPSGDAIRDKQLRKLVHAVTPGCMFHYGWDTPLADALELVLKNSPTPVVVHDSRYVIVSGQSGPYLGGRGFLWVDMQTGIALGGFFFRPTNGEPTPTVAVFSRQVKDDSLRLSQLPPAFVNDLNVWSMRSRVPPVTTRYFITGSNKRILLEHDEDYCMTPNQPGTAGACLQMNADAADIDETAAYYLDQVHYATNATAWMIGQDQIAWLEIRENTCRGVLDPLGCRIRVTREHTHTIVHRHTVQRPTTR